MLPNICGIISTPTSRRLCDVCPNPHLRCRTFGDGSAPGVNKPVGVLAHSGGREDTHLHSTRLLCLLFDAAREFGDLVVDLASLIHELPDLAIGMHHGGVVAAAEFCADLRQ